MACPRILHVLPHLRAGGAAGSLAATARLMRADGFAAEHRVLPLEPIVSPLARLEMARAGVAILPGETTMTAAADAADLMVVHFWNTPHALAFLEQIPERIPLVAWIKVAGGAPPQILPLALAERADRLILTTAATLGHLPLVGRPDLVARATVVRGIMDPARLTDLARRPHDGFVVTYVGTVGPGKIHPRFVDLSLGAAIDDARFLVCGSGGGEAALAAAAAAVGAADRFELQGYVADIRPVLAVTDVFGYPQARDTYSSSDRSLQEAMHAGIPPVILRHGGIVDMVRHEESGLVVDEADYGAALAHLRHHPDERARLGANAAHHARVEFDVERAARRAAGIMREALAQGARQHARHSPSPGGLQAARRFADALGPWGLPFRASLAGGAAAIAADAAIAATSAAAVRVEGGLFHHRNAAPDDAALRFWTGLVLLAEGRAEAARKELAAASAGLPEAWRVAVWQAAACRLAGDPEAADEHARRAATTAPDPASLARAATAAARARPSPAP